MIRYYIDSILQWLDDHSPVWCGTCGSVYFKKDMSYHLLTTREGMWLCKDCKRNIFEPFKRKEDV